LSADGRQEDFQVAARDQFRVHAARLLEQRAAQVGLAHVEAPGHPGQPPHRLQRDLGHRCRRVLQQDAPVNGQALEREGLLDLRQVDVRLGDGDGGPDVVALRQVLGVDLLHAGAPGVDGDDLVGLTPLRMGADGVGGRGVGQVGPVAAREVARRHGQRPVHAVAAAVRAHHVALAAVRCRAHQRAAHQRVGRTPVEGRRTAGTLAGMRGQTDVACWNGGFCGHQGLREVALRPALRRGKA